MKEIKIIDTTLRDGPQSLWATRMSTPMMLPVLEKINEVGYDSVELMAMAHFDACVRYLDEDPWERIRIVNEHIKDVPTIAWIRSKNLIGFDMYSDDLVELMVNKMVDNGIGKIAVFDGLLDIDNMVVSLNAAKERGALTVGALVFSESPIHTDELYREKTKELITKANVDTVMLKDAGGVLTPERVKTLVPVMKEVLGDIPLELHGHSLTGLAPMVYIEAVKAGVDIVHMAVSPLSNGASQPTTQTVVKNLRDLGYKIKVNDRLIDEISEHFFKVAETEGFPIGQVAEYDAFHYKHQIPGGMLSNMVSQLEAAGIADKYDEVLEEIGRIREDLAWPIMVTPFSQLVGTQAVLNVMNGERYKVIPDEVKKYVLGHYGKLIAPIKQNIVKKIVENGSKSITVKKNEGKFVPELRNRYPNMTDEERILRYLIKGNHVDRMKQAGPINTSNELLDNPVVTLMKNITNNKNYSYVSVSNKGTKIRLGALK